MVKRSCDHDYNISAHLCFQKNCGQVPVNFWGRNTTARQKSRRAAMEERSTRRPQSEIIPLYPVVSAHPSFGPSRLPRAPWNALVEDFTLNKDVEGTEYITFEENLSKTRYVSLIFWFLTTASTAKIFKNDFHLTFPCCLLDFWCFVQEAVNHVRTDVKKMLRI